MGGSATGIVFTHEPSQAGQKGSWRLEEGQEANEELWCCGVNRYDRIEQANAMV